MEIENSKRHAKPAFAERRRPLQKRGIAESASGRSVHGRTKLQADAKAGKNEAHPGLIETAGGEIVSGLATPGARPSRKSTRGSVPAGEKASSMTTARKGSLYTPESRAARRK
jgi:hypothetical protein